VTDQNAIAQSENNLTANNSGDQNTLTSLSTKEIKKLYNLSRSVRALSFFWLLVIALCVVFTATAAPGTMALVMFPTFAVLAAFAAVGIWLFQSWSRILSMVLCVILLLAFPIGTIFGVLGFIALWGSKRLFGPNRLSQKQLHKELEHRKLDTPLNANVRHQGDVMTPESDGPRGIGGWLILVILSLVLSPLRITYTLLTIHWPIFRDGTWQTLTTPGSPAYHHLWGPLLAFEIIGHLIAIALAIVTLVMLLRQSKRTPAFAIGWFAYAAAFVTVDYFVGDLIPYLEQHPDPDSIKELVRGVVPAAIWIPYFLVSKRVKATFVK
jgi:Protein of unknown function (DUF2569)